MATLFEIYQLSRNTDLRNRILAAMWKAAEDIRNESDQTTLHTQRLVLAKAWSESMEDSDTTKAIMRMVVQNTTIQTTGGTVDNDLQFVVNGLVNYFTVG